MTKSVDYEYARPKLAIIYILEQRYLKFKKRIDKYVQLTNNVNYPERWYTKMEKISDDLFNAIADYEDHGFIYKEGDAKYGYVRPKQLP